MALAPKVIILDFDGTVADTMPFLVDLAARLLRSRYGLLDSEARRAYIETTGLPFCKQIEIIFPGNPLNEATVREFEGEKLGHLGEFAFFPDALAVLAEIRIRGVKVCLSSGNYESLIREVLASRGVVVDLVMGFRPGFEKGPQHFRFAAETFAAQREQVVFVGDSIKDGLAAREAGISFIARAGLVSVEEIRRQLPGVPVVESLTEVLPLLGIK
jgi:phosphoglycolate phosphatase